MELEKRENGEDMDSIFRGCELENMGLESDNGGDELNQEQGQCSSSSSSDYLDKFTLFETSSVSFLTFSCFSILLTSQFLIISFDFGSIKVQFGWMETILKINIFKGGT